MTVAIHQPNFLPWMGYFYKISQCDTFVFFDNAEYTKRSFIRRVKIHRPYRPEEDKYLIVPLQKHSDFAQIDELQLMTDMQWRRRIQAQIHQSYHKAKHYHQVQPVMDFLSSKRTEDLSFSQFSSELIIMIADQLGIAVQWNYSHDLDIGTHKAQANIDMVRAMGGNRYVSGMGAKKYQNNQQYEEFGIELVYSDYPSFFRGMDYPPHLLNKSIVSYLSLYHIDDLQAILQKEREVSLTNNK